MNARSNVRPLLVSCCVAAFGLTLGTAQTLHAQTTVPASQTAIETASDARAGHSAFTQNCSICHGANAQGFIGPKIAGIAFGSAGLREIVRHGLGGYGGMPAFSSDSVSDETMGKIAAYLASLAPPVVAAVPTNPGLPTATASPAETSLPTGSPSPSTRTSPTASLDDGDPTRGKTLFGYDCAACHGAAGQGGLGPSLKNEKSRKDFAAAVAWVKNPKPPMPKLFPDTLSERDVRDVAAYVEKF